MLKELLKEDVKEFLTDIKENNVALLFHIPGHCAGCARVINILKEADTSAWTIYLVNVDDEQNRELVKNYDVSSAPTIVYYTKGYSGKIIGLKNFLENKNIFS